MKFRTSTYQKRRVAYLDTVELLTATHYKKDFPVHSHDTFCISLIEQGTFNENDLFATQGTICITNPSEIHTNELVHETGYSFKTFYLSPPVLQHINGQRPVFFQQKIITDQAIYTGLQEVAQRMQQDNEPNVDVNRLADLLTRLVGQYSENCCQRVLSADRNTTLADVTGFIKNSLHQKISLQELAAIASMDKFRFIRFFKKQTGLSPFAYIILQRIEKSKVLLKSGNPIIDAALDAGFYDQSHFSNYFTYYVGVTPAEYQTGCNIFQD